MERRGTDRHRTKNAGSVLVVTILITSVMFGIGTTFASILEKEVSRQVYEDRSQTSINIANTALECALYNDFRRNVFTSSVARSVTCGSLYQIRPTGDWSGTYSAATGHGTVTGTGTYEFAVIDSRDESLSGVSDVPCAHVIVERRCVGDTTGTVCDSGIISVSIEVRGYDACSSGDERQRDVVRRFKVHY